MRSLLTILGFAALVSAQAVTQLIVPSSTPPAGCENSRQGSFHLSIVNVTTSNANAPAPSRRSSDNILGRDLETLQRRQTSGLLTLTLRGGILTDQANRTGYIASNYQFQFDGPPQAGAIYTAGWGICSNGSLSLGGQAIFWQCLSGSFYNLYDRDWAEHCVAVYFQSIEGAGSAFSTNPPGPVSTGPSENTIANGGGTATTNSTYTFGGTTQTTEATMTASSASMESSASSAGASGSMSASSSASASASGSSSGAYAIMPMGVLQQTLAWAVGIVGAIALA